MRRITVTQETLKRLDTVPFEQWRNHGVSLRAVSANADGIVNSGILQDRRYFYRKWEAGFTSSQLVFETN